MTSNNDEYIDWQSGELRIVKNHENICSIWPVDKQLPIGWEAIGFSGNKEACLKKIEEICDGNCKLITN
jgi:MbtH protein